MNVAKRGNFTAGFKARTAPEVLRGDKTAQQVATNHDAHTNQLSQWKHNASGELLEQDLGACPTEIQSGRRARWMVAVDDVREVGCDSSLM